MTNNDFEFNNNLETKINIPNPKMVATWLGPKPPVNSLLEPVVNVMSLKLGV